MEFSANVERFDKKFLNVTKMTKKAEILIETRERILVRRLPNEIHAFCPECQASINFISPDTAAIVTRLTMRQIFCLVESGVIHSLETAEGLTFVCPTSVHHGRANIRGDHGYV